MKDFIKATEYACKNDAEELRAKVLSELKTEHTKIKQNITTNERRAIRDLTKDNTIKILPADKGKCIRVILDTETYKEKCKELLRDSITYKKPDEKMHFFVDVTALFTSVPVDKALQVVKK